MILLSYDPILDVALGKKCSIEAFILSVLDPLTYPIYPLPKTSIIFFFFPNNYSGRLKLVFFTSYFMNDAITVLSALAFLQVTHC